MKAEFGQKGSKKKYQKIHVWMNYQKTDFSKSQNYSL